ncbi:TonB family protein [Glaciecola sp. XM2]|jgi:TonB family protein|uniref:TonB family protein n=1 Tax=Glaciecola sp. XM2 TaxID=1914931 RepID=UPI001BDE5C1C|nr:TonB family protein [Glaciecola sp. XM2]MBT1451209.1 TonB family protein [Glaciecola sp. XM2]
MIEFIYDATLIFSVLCLFIIVARRPLTKLFGARQTYQLWSSVPLAIFLLGLPVSAVFTLNITSTFVVNVTAPLNNNPPVLSHSYSDLFTIIYFVGFSFGAVAYSFIVLKHTLIRKRTHVANMKSSFNENDSGCFMSTKLPDVEYSYPDASPYLVGILHPRLVLPANFSEIFSEQEQRLIIEHEHTHFRRKDLIWNQIALLLLLMFWFNPLAWFAFNLFRQDQELACDEAVLASADRHTRKLYADALIKSASLRPAFIHTTNFGNFVKLGEKTMLTQRIYHAMQAHKYSRFFTLSLLIIVGIMSTTQLNAETSLPVDEKYLKPIVRIDPSYPETATQNNIEGWVVLEYMVSQNGTVEEIRVVDSEPAGVFDESARMAVAKWRYLPNDTFRPAVNTIQLDFRLSEE